MTDVKTKSTRRAFFLNGGAVLGAGIAATAGAAGLAPAAGKQASSAPAEGKASARAEDREAIRRLHLAFISQLESRSDEGAPDLFGDAQMSAYRQTTSQQQDEVRFSEDGLCANATFHCEVELCTPLQGDCTAAQMARLQGHVESRRWESGRFETSYVKKQGRWAMVSARYLSA